MNLLVGARRRLVALSVLAATLSVASAPTTSSAQDGCAQPYKPMWMDVAGIWINEYAWPPYPHDPPFWSGDVGQPGGPMMVGGMPPYSYADGVLTVGEGDEKATFEGHAISIESSAGLVEFEGRRYLTLQSYVSHGSFKALLIFWDFDDPCRQLPDTSAEPTVPSENADGGRPAGAAEPVSGTPGYTG